MFEKILIANRGEIATRIIRTCRKMGIRTVAVHSDIDLRSPYVREADEVVSIGGTHAQDSYLNAAKIVAAARERTCQAVHPGYGFLSENSGFATLVAQAGLVFIGPPPPAIEALGNKVSSKTLAKRLGLPVIPDHPEPLRDPKGALGAAQGLGYPVILKPASGGGGRGMRIVHAAAELPSALAASQEEVRKSFGDDRIFVERYIPHPRHIEIQVVADQHGQVIHLGERECSIQRRHQKVIEESPSPAVDPDLRAEMGQAACALIRAASYHNLGTVEFLLAPDRSFYFMEVNTRLQVEHPITELTTGIDLVELQIRLAAGQPLDLNQSEVSLRGWAIEARVCAEDPSHGFLPTTGMITRYALPSGKNIRVESGVEAGSVITIHYDSLLSKVAAWGEDREAARQTLVRALNGYHLEGLRTNVNFVNAVVNHPAFCQGELSTDFIEENFVEGQSRFAPDLVHLEHMVIAAVLVYHNRQSLMRESLKPMSPLVGGTPYPRKFHEYVVRADQDVFRVRIEGDQAIRRWTVHLDQKAYQVVTPEFEYYRRRLLLRINGISHMFQLEYDEQHIRTSYCGLVRTFEIYSPDEWSLAHFMLREPKEVSDNVLRCPMPGLVAEVYLKAGQSVRKGQEVLRIESMKMESVITSPRDGQVDQVLVCIGQALEKDETLLTFKST